MFKSLNLKSSLFFIIVIIAISIQNCSSMNLKKAKLRCRDIYVAIPNKSTDAVKTQTCNTKQTEFIAQCAKEKGSVVAKGCKPYYGDYEISVTCCYN